MKKITSLFAVLAMLATFVVMPVSAATGYAGGDGLTAETSMKSQLQINLHMRQRK